MSTSAESKTVSPTPYIRVHPDFHLVLEDKARGGGDEKGKVSQEAPSAASSSLGLESKTVVAAAPKKASPSFWISAYELGGDSVHDDIDLQSVQLTEKSVTCSWKARENQYSVDFLHPLRLRVKCLARASPFAGLTVEAQAPVASWSHLHPAGTAAGSRFPDILSLAVSGDGELGASGSLRGQLRVWSAATGKLLHDLGAAPASSSSSATGAGSAAESKGEKQAVASAATAKPSGHVGDVTALRFFPSNQVLLSGATDLQLKIWSLADGTCAQTLKGHSRAISAVDMIGRGRHVVSASKDGTTKLWDCGNQTPLAVYGGATGGGVNDCLLVDAGRAEVKLSSPTAAAGSGAGSGSGSGSGSSSLPDAVNGQLLLSAYDDSVVRGFDLRAPGAGASALSLQLALGQQVGGASRLAALSPFAVLAGTELGVVRAFDLRQTSVPLFSVRKNDAAITSLLGVSDKSFVMASAEGDVTLWQAGSGSGASSSSLSVSTEFVGVDCEPAWALAAHGGWLFSAGSGAVRKYPLAA